MNNRMTAKALAMAAAMLCAMAVTPRSSADATLTLDFTSASGPFNPGDQVQVTLRMSGLAPAQLAAGFQAFLRFDDERLAFVNAAYTSAPFGQHIIVPIVANGDEIDVASGIDIFTGQLPTAADSDLVYLTFETLTECGMGVVEFRPHDPPTRITTLAGLEILPLTLVNMSANPTCASDVFPAGGGDGEVDVDDLIQVILSWGACPPSPVCCPGNTNGDAAVDVDDLIAVILDWGSCP